MITLFGKTLCERCFSENTEDPCGICGFSASEYHPDSTALPVGQKLQERYLIGGVIGKGGFGITYIAFDTKLERRVAIKEYYPYGLAIRTPGTSMISVPDAESSDIFGKGAEKFYDEARLVAKFSDNQNIVSIYDFFYENSTVYYVMEYLQGQSMKKYVENHGVVSPEQAVYIAKEVSNALVSSHSANVLHRDISPDNIILCNNGKVKLIDFGAARQVLSEGSQSLSVILKQGFAPLEQYRKKGKQGPWTDIYALGATIYYLTTGDMLDDPISRLDDDEAFSSNACGINNELWNVIRKSTMLRPNDRYKDIFEFREALDNMSISFIPLNVTYDNPVGVLNFITESTSVSAPLPVREAAPVGATMPVKEAALISATMPAREQAPPKKSVVSANPGDIEEKSPASAAAAKMPEKKKKKRLMIAAGFVAVAFTVFICVYFSTHVNLGGSWAEWNGNSGYAKVSGKEITDLSPLVKKAKNKSDVRIDLYDCTLSDPSVLKELENIDNLHSITLNNCDLSDISALEGITKLTSLNLRDNNISDISVLKNMTELTSLNLRDNRISDISALKNMTELNFLDLSGNNISDISVLKNMTKLTYLDLGSNGFSDISALKYTTKLTYLNLGDRYRYDDIISDFSALKNLTDLNTLSLTYKGKYYRFSDADEIKEFLEKI